MLPTNDHAQKRSEAGQLIRDYAPRRFHEQLIALLRPSISLNAIRIDEAQIPLGASKFGGSPDVPTGFEWPMWNDYPLGFVAQINLEEVAPYDLEKQLPRSGLLWFFLSLNEQKRVWGESQQREGWRVVLGHNPEQRVKVPLESHWIELVQSQRVTFQLDWQFGDNSFESWDWDEEEWSDFQWEILERVPHRMLSCPYAPQLSPFIIAANGMHGATGLDLYDEGVSTRDWELLLQIDTGDSVFFDGINDLGWLYFMVRRSDLSNNDFSSVWFNSQST